MFCDLFSKKEERKEPEFITGSQFSYYLEQLLNEAKQFIIIVSPYIRFSQRIYDCLSQKRKDNVTITIIYREDFFHSEIANMLFKRVNLHAKCYITENALLSGSMNLYDSSQTNNDEFGFLFLREAFPETYNKVFTEVRKLYHSYDGHYVAPRNTAGPNSEKNETIPQKVLPAALERKRRYSQDELKKFFNYSGKLRGGINQINETTIVLIWRSNSKYQNRYANDIVYYMGQDTGKEEQELIYGNKILYEAYDNANVHIYLIKDDIYCGECHICEKPYLENGKWIFPLKSYERNVTPKKLDRLDQNQDIDAQETSLTLKLEKQRKYSEEELKEIFHYDGTLYGGVNKLDTKTVLLLWYSKSPKRRNRYENGVLYYMGQDTGTEEQLLFYGNALLYDAYENKDIHIHLVKDWVYCGECYVCEKPYLENGKWIFPLKGFNDVMVEEDHIGSETHQNLREKQAEYKYASRNLIGNCNETIEWNGHSIRTRREHTMTFQDFVKQTLDFFFANNLLSDDELDKLKTKEYSEQTFCIDYAFFVDDKTKIYDEQGCPKYWSTKEFPGGLYACKQWWKGKMHIYEPLFAKWITYIIQKNSNGKIGN